MTVATVGILVWALIYGGLFTMAVGLALLASHGIYASSMAVVGGVLVAVGISLIWVRSRMAARLAKPLKNHSTHGPNPPSEGKR